MPNSTRRLLLGRPAAPADPVGRDGLAPSLRPPRRSSASVLLLSCRSLPIRGPNFGVAASSKLPGPSHTVCLPASLPRWPAAAVLDQGFPSHSSLVSSCCWSLTHSHMRETRLEPVIQAMHCMFQDMQRESRLNFRLVGAGVTHSVGPVSVGHGVRAAVLPTLECSEVFVSASFSISVPAYASPLPWMKSATFFSRV